MSSSLWPIPITFAIYKGFYALSNAILSASKLGGIEDPTKWWHWLLFAVLFFAFQLGYDIAKSSSND